MPEVINFLKTNEVWLIPTAMWVFSLAVDCLPAPKENGSQFYLFMYRFAHGLAANVSEARKPTTK